MSNCGFSVDCNWECPGCDREERPAQQNVAWDAIHVVYGDRQKEYGHPQPNFDRITALWNAYLSTRECGTSGVITNQDHALMMILLKIARLSETPDHRDSLIDLIGYALTIERLWTGA